MKYIHGKNPHEVVDLMKGRRKHGRSFHGNRKLGLIVEGGGMRGVLSAGSLLAVDLLGFRDVFDEVYAASSGAVNAAYFLSGQGELGITVYFDSINNRKFINPLRVNKIVDVGFVYDHIVTEVKPLDESTIRNGNTRFRISLTDVASGNNVLADARTWNDPIAVMLKASAALPVLYNRTVLVNGSRYVDGGLSDAVLVRQAIAEGCTDILVLLTKPKEYISAPPSAPFRWLFYALIGNRYPNLMAAYVSAYKRNNACRDMAFGNDLKSGVNIATICPSGEEMIIGRVTMDREKLIDGAHQLARKAVHGFSEGTTQIDAAFSRFRSGN